MLNPDNQDNRPTMEFGPNPVMIQKPQRTSYDYLDVDIVKGTDKVYGFSMKFDSQLPVVKSIISKTPADRSCLKIDDQIFSVNGVVVEGLPSTKILKIVSEVEASELNLRVRRLPQSTSDSSSDDDEEDDFVFVTITKRQHDSTYGFSLKFDENSNQLPRIGVVKAESPAAIANLKGNDTIHAINDAKLDSLSRDQVFSLIKNSPSQVVLKVSVNILIFLLLS